MDSVEIVLLCELCKLEFTGGRTVLGIDTHLKVLLGGIGDDLAEELSKLCCVLCFLKCCLLPVKSYLGITLTGSNTTHCQIHTDLGALALKVCTQTADDLLLNLGGDICAELLADTYNMLGCPSLVVSLQRELAAGNLALGAELGGSVAFVNIAAYGAYPFLHNNILQ